MDWKIKLAIVIIVIPIAVIMWPSFLGGNTDLFMVEGNSMLPTILPGSIVITKKQPTYEVDDIVAYQQSQGRLSKTIVHRIIDINEKGFVLKGDNNSSVDPGFFKENKVIGKVVFSTPYVGYLLSLIRNPIVMVVTATGIILVDHQLKKRKKSAKKPTYNSILQSKSTNSVRQSWNKQKGPNYMLFFIASGLNILVYIAQQIALANGKNITGDFITGFLFSNLEESIASSTSFAVYFGVFIMLYFYAKRGEETYLYKSRSGFSQKNLTSNSALRGIQIIWLLFVIMEIYHLITLVGAFR